MPGRPRLSRPARRRPRRGALLVAPVVPVLLLGACSSPVTVPAAQDGGSPGCAEVDAVLPEQVAGESRRQTTGGAGTAAWGDPAILLRCGVEPVVVSSQPCVGVPGEDGDEVDWVVLASDETGAILRTFGREPAVEVEVPGGYGPAPVNVLPDLSDAVSVVPATAVCVT